MIRDKKGKVTPLGAEALVVISPLVFSIMEYLADLGLGPEESLGLLTGAAAANLPAQRIRRENQKKVLPDIETVHDRGRKLDEIFRRYLEGANLG